MSTKNYHLFFLIIAFLSFSANANAQRRYSAASNNILIGAYLDSLSIYKAEIDSLKRSSDSLRASLGYPAENKYFRLFSPTAFYRDIAGRSFSLGNNASNSIDNGMMYIYLHHPELVEYSAKNISKKEKSTKLTDITKRPERIELTKQVQETQTQTVPDIEAEPIDMVVTKPNFWTFHGDYYLQFLQNYISSNWYKSGSNSYSMMGTVTLQYNYNNKQKVKWDNKLEMRLGFQTTEADTVNQFKTSDDLIRYTSKLGLQAHANWYYTMQLIAQTQFTRGLKNNNDYVYSDFMSPFSLNLSVGMDYTVNTKNKKLTGTIHIAPLAFQFKYVDRRYLAPSFGINGGHRTLENFGSQYTVDLTWTPFNNFKWKTRLYGYTTYHKYEMEWENTFTLQFNKYISTCLYLYPRFDDSVNRTDEHSYIQFKEYFSFGFSYSM